MLNLGFWAFLVNRISAGVLRRAATNAQQCSYLTCSVRDQGSPLSCPPQLANYRKVLWGIKSTRRCIGGIASLHWDEPSTPRLSKPRCNLGR
jgi:hypothetical protein